MSLQEKKEIETGRPVIKRAKIYKPRGSYAIWLDNNVQQQPNVSNGNSNRHFTTAATDCLAILCLNVCLLAFLLILCVCC